jgi:predicted TIM-barrel fold metal-dependent hydrolase
VTDLTVDNILLPDPEPREVKYTVISVDDHVVEPAHAFEGRLPRKLQDRAPRIVEDEDGRLSWLFDGQLRTITGSGCTAGLRDGYGGFMAWRYEHMRPACYDADARISDMDINGVWACINFPENLSGFAGRIYSNCSDPAVGLAVVRAWNDWYYEEWYSKHPDRLIPMGLTFMRDAEEGAAEIRRNAARGFRAVSLPERPQRIGLPDLFSGHWDPIVQACAETGTVINVHIGSSGLYNAPEGAPVALTAAMFGQMSMASCAEWLFSDYPWRFPDLKIAMSEGGIGWVAMLMDRLDNIVEKSGYGINEKYLKEPPAQVLKEHFWFCALDDPSTIDTRHRIGVENILVEVDFPHGDGTWPNTQHEIQKLWGHIPPAEVRKMCCENAAALYRHPLPETVLPLL